MMPSSHNRRRHKREGWALFEAEAVYADSIPQRHQRRIRALERAVKFSPGYAPAVDVVMDPSDELVRENLSCCN